MVQLANYPPGLETGIWKPRSACSAPSSRFIKKFPLISSTAHLDMQEVSRVFAQPSLKRKR